MHLVVNGASGGAGRLLVLTAELSRTGVPVALARMVGWLHRRHPEVAVDVLAGRDGPVGADLRAAGARVVALAPAGRRSAAGSAAAALDQAGLARAADAVRSAEVRLHRRGAPPPSAVLVQGAGGLPLLDHLGPVDGRVVVHLHELATGLSRSGPAAALRRGVSRADRVLAVTTGVADAASAAGLPAGRVLVVPGAVDLPTPGGPAGAAALPPGRWVGGVGAPGWRKGTDRVVALAHALPRERPGTGVAWVGGRPGGPAAPWVGAPDPVRWVAPRPDPWEVLAGVDVVVVPSREDPLPLVALEAGVRALPVVGTASGGLAGLLAHGRGRLVGAHDLRGLLAAVVGLLDDPDAAAAAGAALADHVRAHHLVDVVGPAWWSAVTGG